MKSIECVRKCIYDGAGIPEDSKESRVSREDSVCTVKSAECGDKTKRIQMNEHIPRKGYHQTLP